MPISGNYQTKSKKYAVYLRTYGIKESCTYQKAAGKNRKRFTVFCYENGTEVQEILGRLREDVDFQKVWTALNEVNRIIRNSGKNERKVNNDFI